MKYLFVNASLTTGGSERVMTLIANEFAELGCETSMVLLRQKKERTYPVSSKLNLIQFSYSNNNKILKGISRFFQFRRLLKSLKPDAIISFMWDINTFVLLASLGFKTKIIISDRTDPSIKFKNKLKWIAQRLSKRIIYYLADKLVLQTENVKQYYKPKIQNKSVVIPNPINSNIPSPFEGFRENKIVAAGRFVEAKNFKMLISAFAKFYETHQHYKLIIYGEGQLRGELEKLIQDLKLHSVIELPGYISNVNEAMKNARMYVSSSNFEGISNSMLEALALGIPSICTDCPVGGAALAIKHNENGILIPVGDTEALVQAMKKIADDNDFSEKISQEALKIKTQFAISKIAKKWINEIQCLFT